MPLSLLPHEEDECFWREHAYVRLRPSARIDTEPSEIMLENRIWFGSVASQDDIFEGSPTFSADPSTVNLDSIRRLAQRQMREARAEQIEAEARRIFEELSDPRIFEHRMQLLSNRYRDIFRASSILSFFRDPTVQRNWHDYASQGRGFGAVFDFREPWQYECAPGLPGEWVPFPIRYVSADEIPAIQVQAAPVGAQEGFADIETALLTKSDEWSNQGEERLFRIGIGPGHVEFPERSLRAMLLGYDCPVETQQHIMQLAAQRVEPLPVFKVQPAPPTRRLAVLRLQ